MSEEYEFGSAVAETTVTGDPPVTDPRLYSDAGGDPAAVWATSDRLREMIERKERHPPAADRQFLAAESQRQLSTLGLYREIHRLLYEEPLDPRATVGLYVLLFPGEARDNTGIKDLNDKVLGYRRTSRFITARQDEIRAIFPPPGGPAGPGFITVGQDYKTASVVAAGRTPEEFAAGLAKLDDRLRDRLLELLIEAENDKETEPAKLKEIRNLRGILETSKRRKKPYRFDYLFGADALTPRVQLVDVTMQLQTEALKGAGLARFAAKGQRLRTKVAKRFLKGRGTDRVAKGHDPRGRTFHTDTFRRVLTAADDLRKLMTTRPDDKTWPDYRFIFVDTVWTTSFLAHKRVYFGNPDVIRDVRKGLLQPPTQMKQGLKVNFAEHKELLELWLVTLNTLDFVKDFTTVEFPRTGIIHALGAQHERGWLILRDLQDPTKPVDWSRLSRFLTRDVRDRTDEPIAVQGTASEFRFYCHAADHPDQIFFVMDVRDLGVDLMAFYEAAQMTIVDGRLAGDALMREGLESTDAIVERKRVTCEKVIEVFRRHYPTAAGLGTGAAAMEAFGGALQDSGPMPLFRESLQIMLGGDEVFVAAHPYYARCAHLIIADLAREQFQDRSAPPRASLLAGRGLNLRSGVAYSSATRLRQGSRAGQATGDPQRRENQKAHDEALKLATEALGLLKPFERAHRRIERLIEKLEQNEDKKDKAPPYRQQLQRLHLLEMYVRVKHKHARRLSVHLHTRLHRALKAGDLATAEKTRAELVDFAGRAVDGAKLDAERKKLEDAVRRDVGSDNVHVDYPPPGWLKRLFDFLRPKDPKDPDKDKDKVITT